MQANALSVSALNEYVRRSLAGDPMLQGIAVRGEVSNFRPYASGHWYFSLKDEESRIACVMFRQHNAYLGFLPSDGMRVVLIGSAGLYVSSGSYQFYAEAMLRDGVGELYQRFQILKDKLLKEGLFDASRKRPLPLLPRAVGIVTSSSGAVIHDIRTVCARRFPGIPLILRPSQVQGEGAKEDLTAALRELSGIDEVDVIIIGRGGGSMEDLWAFNEEIVVRAVAACPKPVISAVGHETDTTLCDFAADMRAPTPSAAAELAVPDRRELLRMAEAMKARMIQGAQKTLLERRAIAEELTKRLTAQSPQMALERSLHRISIARQSIQSLAEQGIQALGVRLEKLSGSLSAMGPGSTLKRGYVMAISGGKPITKAMDLPERFTLIFQDGRAEAQTLSRESGEFI